MSLPAALGLLFIALKLTGYIQWSWWLVLMPLWVGVPVVILLVIISLWVRGI